MHPKELSIKDFTYQLPDEKIALYPLAERDSSRLLVYRNGIIQDGLYKNISHYLPENSLLFFNDTKVINARIRFQKTTGGIIEVFCLEPVEAGSEYSTVMNKQEKVQWKCMIGGASKWKAGGLKKKIRINNEELIISATLVEKLPDAYVVELSWLPAAYSFAAVIEHAGDIPLPPYIKRETETSDTGRYQTVYAKDEGSVAAPTAGLHFTNGIFRSFIKKNIHTDFITLHVGAGTFKPVKAATLEEHEMQAEWIDVTISTIENLVSRLQHDCIAVGTTSARTLESIYWMGIKVYLDPTLTEIQLKQWEVYEEPLLTHAIPAKDALLALLNWCRHKKLTRFFTQTKIIIAPGYRFKLINGLITNFHQPQSTLLLLIAAAVGDNWKKIYEHALENDFRFLSYGDGCLLFMNDQ